MMDAPEVMRPSHSSKYYVPPYHDAPEVLPSPPANAQEPYSDKYYAEPETKILGLAPKTFWIIVVLLIVTVAAAVGGGVGGGLASQKKSSSPSSQSSPAGITTPLLQSSTSSSSATPTSSSTSSTSTSSGTSTTSTASIIRTSTTRSTTSASSSTSSAAAPAFSTGCNATDGTVFTPLDTSDSDAPFSINGTTLIYRIACNTNLASKTSGNNPQISEVLRQQDVATLDDCITLCAAYNKALVAPTLDALCSVPVYASGTPNYCYLQSGTAVDAVTVEYGSDQEIATAILQFPGLN